MATHTAAPRFSLSRYRDESRDPTNSLILVAPLFVIYQIGILTTDGWRNGADLFSGWLMRLTGGDILAYTAVNFVALAACLGLYIRRRKAGGLHPDTAVLVVIESTIHAILAGLIASQTLLRLGLEPAMIAAAAGIHEMGPLDTLVMCIGAGTYEELVFRGIVLTGLAWALTRRMRSRSLAMVGAVLLSSAIFSAFHYWPFGLDPWEAWSFSYRLLLGIAFAILYLWRGFAVAVYTHAIYDIFVLMPDALLG